MEFFIQFHIGLDLAHSYNGYVYHTKFDTADIIPRGTLQTTGDNILGMARAFTNSTELKDPSVSYKEIKNRAKEILYLNTCKLIFYFP